MNENIETLFQCARIQLQQNCLEDALLTYQKICSLNPHNADALFALGTIAGNLGKLDICAQALEQACQQSSGFGRAHDSLIQVLQLQSKFQQAISILQKFQSSPDRPYDYDFKMGYLYGKLGDFDNAITYLQKTIAIDKTNSLAYHCLATAYESINDSASADAYYLKAIDLSPQDFQLHTNYGAMLQKQGKLDQAIQHYELSIRINDHNPLAYHNAGTVHYLAGNNEMAIQSFATALRLQSDYFEAMVGLGKCYRAIGDKRLSIQYFKDALVLHPDNVEVLVSLGYCLIVGGEFDDALDSLNRAITVEPDNIEARAALVLLHERQGEFGEAEKILRELLDTGLENREIAIAYSVMCQHLGGCDEALKYINNILVDNSITPPQKSLLHYNAGKILDSTLRYNDAFSHYVAANEVLSQRYIREHAQISIENIQKIFTYKSIRDITVDVKHNFKPIFILGMPRSGTSLLEQILSCHHKVEGAGELPYLTDLSYQVWGDFMTGGNGVMQMAPADIRTFNRLASEYRQLVKYSANEMTITDKMPHNFRLIGLINILFPDAKIIHCTRNPIDTCLSIYFSNFGLSHPYANNLSNIAEYYSDYYLPLMEYWMVISKIPIHTVSYEDLINDKELSIKTLLNYCGLDWDDRCLNHHLSDRKVKTVSYDQVRKPVYTSSINRWKNYESHIGPLIERFSYVLDEELLASTRTEI